MEWQALTWVKFSAIPAQNKPLINVKFTEAQLKLVHLEIENSLTRVLLCLVRVFL